MHEEKRCKIKICLVSVALQEDPRQCRIDEKNNGPPSLKMFKLKQVRGRLVDEKITPQF